MQERKYNLKHEREMPLLKIQPGSFRQERFYWCRFDDQSAITFQQKFLIDQWIVLFCVTPSKLQHNNSSRLEASWTTHLQRKKKKDHSTKIPITHLIVGRCKFWIARNLRVGQARLAITSDLENENANVHREQISQAPILKFKYLGAPMPRRCSPVG